MTDKPNISQFIAQKHDQSLFLHRPEHPTVGACFYWYERGLCEIKEIQTDYRDIREFCPIDPRTLIFHLPLKPELPSIRISIEDFTHGWDTGEFSHEDFCPKCAHPLDHYDGLKCTNKSCNYSYKTNGVTFLE